MDIGDKNEKGQVLIRKTNMKSTTHSNPRVRIWVMYCPTCNTQYGSNSCDAHIRKCPYHQNGAKGEPI